MTSASGESRPAPSDAARRSGPALEAMFQFIVWLVPTLDKFPRSQRFLLGDRIQTTALDVLEQLIEAHPVCSRAGADVAKATSGVQESVQVPS